MQARVQQQITAQQIIDHIKPRLFSTEYHASRIENLVKRQLCADIVLTWYADLTGLVSIDKDANAAAPITYDLAEKLQLTLDDLERLGQEHTRSAYTARPMSSVLEAFTEASMPAPESPVPLYVLTNEQCMYGASAILDADIQSHLQAVFPDGYLCLGSSIHEFLVVPKSGDPDQPHDLAQMVHAINHDPAVMNPEDVLSDHVYCLNNGNLTVVV